MNSRLISSVNAGLVGLALMAAIALPGLAQPTPPSGGPMMHHGDFLNLTADQKAQMEQIHQETRSQIDAILTAEQKAQLEQERGDRGGRGEPGSDRGERRGDRGERGERGGRPHTPFESLNLTEEQRSQIEAVMRSAKERMTAVLTPEQRQQLQQHWQDRQNRPGKSGQ